MKFALPLVFLFAFTFSIDAIAQGSLVSASNTIKSTKQSNQQLRVRSNKQAAKIVKGRFGGKVLKVKKSKSGYRVKLIKADGHIISVDVNAKTGKIKGNH
jgi:uncharacterized membrane protein YkoI